MDAYKTTGLWISSLAEQQDDSHREHREALRNTFLEFRDKVKVLVAGIQATAPNLTVHDISHLDRLWETASLIAGPNYPLNALEAFVFGGALLLHDSALCYEAYEGGLAGVRATTAWKDAYSYEMLHTTDTEAAENNADFTALRQLHADQAEKLIGHAWINCDNADQLYLLENSSLRNHLGNLIGKIAASHHWTIEDVSSKLTRQFNAPPSYPQDWRVDPVKIACLLRCADAGHFYHDRAPDFLRALLKRSGISANHWKSQNWITRLDVDQSDATRESIVYTSSQDFGPSDRDAWWVASDAVDLLTKEINSSNALLIENSIPDSPAFAIRRVTGAASPELLSKYITTIDWTPFPVNIHVSNIENLADSLGGENLYGKDAHKDNLEIVFRELIQNSTDAIHARKTIEETDFSPNLKIVVRTEVDGENEFMWIDFIDNGVGMSKRVLTGPFLDFGTSFWASNLLHSEFPGLRSSTFRPVGKYGIGFFSVFMAADDVVVTTKTRNGGAESALRLVFSGHSKFRPLLQTGPFDDLPMSASTIVSIKLKERYLPFINDVEITRNVQGVPNIKTDFSDYVIGIAAGITVPISLTRNGIEKLIFKGHPISNINAIADWLTSMSYAKGDSNYPSLSEYIENASNRAEVIVEDGEILGFAALASKVEFQHSCLSARTTGGLSHSAHSRPGAPFVGFMEVHPISAKREPGAYVASDDTLRNWCNSQLNKLKREGLDSIQRLFLPYYLCEFKVDPTEIALLRITVKHENNDDIGATSIVNIEQCVDILETSEVGFFAGEGYGYAESLTVCASDKVIISPVSGGLFSYIRFENGVPANNLGFADCIHRSAIKRGLLPTWRAEETTVRGRFGNAMTLWVCSTALSLQ